MSEPEAVLETRHAGDLLVPDRGKERFRKRHEIPADAVRELDGHDIGAASFHFDGEEAARRSDFKHALSGEIDAAEIVVDGFAQIPQADDFAHPRDAHRVRSRNPRGKAPAAAIHEAWSLRHSSSDVSRTGQDRVLQITFWPRSRRFSAPFSRH